ASNEQHDLAASLVSHLSLSSTRTANSKKTDGDKVESRNVKPVRDVTDGPSVVGQNELSEQHSAPSYDSLKSFDPNQPISDLLAEVQNLLDEAIADVGRIQ